jgi:hypothetical protein
VGFGGAHLGLGRATTLCVVSKTISKTNSSGLQVVDLKRVDQTFLGLKYGGLGLRYGDFGIELRRPGIEVRQLWD